MTIRMEERGTWKTKQIDYEQYIYIEYIFSHWGKYSNTYICTIYKRKGNKNYRMDRPNMIQEKAQETKQLK